MSETKSIVSVRDQIAHQLRADIINGTLTEHTKLKEQALAERFGVSRGPIRDVLLQLSNDGLLVSKNNCGVSVNTAPDTSLQPLMINIRVDIESFSIKKVAKTLDNQDFQYLEGLLLNLQKAFIEQDYAAVTDLDINFHRFFVYKAGGEDLVNLWLPFIYRMRMNYTRLCTAEACINEHKCILAAIKNKDIKAAIKALKANIK